MRGIWTNVTESVHAQLRLVAAREDRSVRAAARRAIELYIRDDTLHVAMRREDLVELLAGEFNAVGATDGRDHAERIVDAILGPVF